MESPKSKGRRDFLKKIGYVATGAVILGAASYLGSQIAAPPKPEEPKTTTPVVTTPKIKYGGIFRIGQFDRPKGLDPGLEIAGVSEEVFENIYSRLARYNMQSVPEPELAKSWDIPNAKTYIFHLKEGVRFHNGRKMIAEDVKYSFERMSKVHPWYKGWFTIIEKIETPDDLTVRIILKTPAAHFMSMIADGKCCIVPKESVEKYGNLQTKGDGTGAFKLDRLEPDFIKLTKNEYYGAIYPGQPYVDEMHWIIIPDESARIAALKAGQVDFINLQTDEGHQTAKQDPNLKTISAPQLGRDVLVLNCTKPPFDKPEVRQAISIGINRQEIIEKARGGMGELTGPFVKVFGNWSLPLEQLPFYPLGYTRQGVEEAKNLLEKAGYSKGLSFEIQASPAYARHIPIAEVIREQLKKINVEAKILSIEWGLLLQNWRSDVRNFQMLCMPYAGRGDPYFYTYDRFHSASAGNASGISDKEIDKLSEDGIATADLAERKKIYDTLQKRILETVPMIYISPYYRLVSMQKYVENYRPIPVAPTNRYLAEVWLNK